MSRSWRDLRLPGDVVEGDLTRPRIHLPHEALHVGRKPVTSALQIPDEIEVEFLIGDAGEVDDPASRCGTSAGKNRPALSSW